MKIKVMPFLTKQGNRVGKAAIEFEEGILAGFNLMGFTICDDNDKGKFVLFPCSLVNPDDIKSGKVSGDKVRPYFFLRPEHPEALDRLEDAILDVYDSMTAFNGPRVSEVTK